MTLQSLLVGRTVQTKRLPATLLNHVEYLNHLHPRNYKVSKKVVHKIEILKI